MVGAAGAHMFNLWESLAFEFMRACGFLDVAVINKGTVFLRKHQLDLISFHNSSGILLIVGRYLIRL